MSLKPSYVRCYRFSKGLVNRVLLVEIEVYFNVSDTCVALVIAIVYKFHLLQSSNVVFLCW